MCFPRFLPWTAFLSTKHGGRRGIRAFGGAPSSEQDKPRQPLMPSGLRFNVRSSSSHASALHLRGSPKTAHRAVQFAPRSFVPILLVRKPLALLRAMPSCVTAAGCFRKRASLARVRSHEPTAENKASHFQTFRRLWFKPLTTAKTPRRQKCRLGVLVEATGFAPLAARPGEQPTGLFSLRPSDMFPSNSRANRSLSARASTLKSRRCS